MSKSKFTKAQLDNFEKYRKVQRSSKYNMLSPQAIRASGLNDNDYVFCIDNYDALATAADGKNSSKTAPTPP